MLTGFLIIFFRKSAEPVMTCYKTVTVLFKWSSLLQNKFESYILDKYNDVRRKHYWVI